MLEQEIPEIAEGVIRINAISREPGYRSKVAVSSSDQRVDCVGACVGVRGNRIKNVTGELAGERIDIGHALRLPGRGGRAADALSEADLQAPERPLVGAHAEEVAEYEAHKR